MTTRQNRGAKAPILPSVFNDLVDILKSVNAASEVISELRRRVEGQKTTNSEQLQLQQNKVKEVLSALSVLQKETGLLWKSINSMRVSILKQSSSTSESKASTSAKALEELKLQNEALQARLRELEEPVNPKGEPAQQED